MPKVNCPIEGYENIILEWPDRWLVRHNEAFWKGYRAVSDEATHSTALLYGCAAVAEVEGVTAQDVNEWPLEVMNWIIKTVYTDGLEKALNPPKNS